MSEPARIGPVIRIEQRRLWQRGAGLGLQDLWERLVGPETSANARVLYLRNGVLALSCSSGGWACELRLKADELVARMNEAGPPEKIRELRLIHHSQKQVKYRK